MTLVVLIASFTIVWQILATYAMWERRNDCDGKNLSFYSLPFTAGVGYGCVATVLLFCEVTFPNKLSAWGNAPEPALLLVALPWIAGTIVSEGLLRLAAEYVAPNLHFWRPFGDPAEDSIV